MNKYAIFFPQFHRVKVNDEAWGYGFTDWDLVSTANAFDLWKRRCPAAGFYDLSNDNDTAARFEEASRVGLDGFGIYHYWFEDGPELDAVERYLLRNSVPENFNYFFIWANESWTRRWAGKNTEILKYVSTSPSRDQVRRHVEYLKPFMVSKSYTMVFERPIFVIYRPELYDNLVGIVNCYRDEFSRIGINPLLGCFIKNVLDRECSSIFDFCYLFEPRLFFNFNGVRKSKFVHLVYKRFLQYFDYSKVDYISEKLGRLLRGTSKTYNFKDFLNYYLSSERENFIESLKCPAQNVLICGWNNAPRYRDRFTAVETPTKEQFLQMLSTSTGYSNFSKDIPLLCNAWNEWSEGAAIEPCQYLGDSLLKMYLSQQ